MSLKFRIINEIWFFFFIFGILMIQHYLKIKIKERGMFYNIKIVFHLSHEK